MDANPRPGESFCELVERLRSEYAALTACTNLCPPLGKHAPHIKTEQIDGCLAECFWFETNTCEEAQPADDAATVAESYQFVRLYDVPGTLSGDILRLRQNMPKVDGHFEIFGDSIRSVENVPCPPTYDDDDSEDLSAMLAVLPEMAVDCAVHFTKKGKYRSEMENHLLCQGGTCRGLPISPHITRLLGKSADGELVFAKLLPRYLVLWRLCSIAIYKRWILHLIDGLRGLHSVDIVHRDLHLENLLFADDGYTLLIGDLEGRWGQRAAPEITKEDVLDSGWTEKSDIYDVGTLIKCIVYANVPVTAQVEWPVPQPFQHIVEACMRQDPASRPGLNELQKMVEEIAED